MSETARALRNGEPQFPRRTAGYFPDDENPQYWVQTLNELQREKATEEARWTARAHCRQYRKGGRKYADVAAQVRAMDPDAQAAYLAGQEMFFGRAQQAAAERHPLPDPPERQEGQTDEQWMVEADKWEVQRAKVEEKRRAEEERILADRKREAQAMESRARVNACIDAAVEREFAGAFVEALRYETLMRAVRDPDDHRKMVFEEPQEVEDLPDAGNALWVFYDSLDTVRSSEVPT